MKTMLKVFLVVLLFTAVALLASPVYWSKEALPSFLQANMPFAAIVGLAAYIMIKLTNWGKPKQNQ